MRNKKAMNYFPHDCATSRDYRILKLEDDLGLAGYAFYFKILEIMCEKNTYFLEKNYKILSKILKKNQTFLKKVVEDYELFEINFEENIFFSEFLKEHLEKKKSLTNIRKSAINERWINKKLSSENDTNVLQKENTKNTNVLSTLYNININKIKENTDYVSIKEKPTTTPTMTDTKEKKMEQNFEQEMFNAPLENEEQKNKNDWSEKQERFRQNFQKILDDADFAEVVRSSYPQFTITELQIIANEFRVRNEAASKYNGIFWDKDYLSELKNHFLNFLTKKVSLKIQKNQNDGNDKGFNPKNIGDEFITEYGDSMPEQVATYDLTTSREDVGASV